MTGAFFLAGDGQTREGPEGPVLEQDFVGTAATAGPWSPDLMHAGPPSALIGRAVETARSIPEFGIPESALVSRMAVDILTPVPVGPVSLRLRTIRPGRRVALVAAELSSGVSGRVAMQARAWCTRQDPELEIPTAAPPASPPAAAGVGLVGSPQDWGSGYLDAIDWTWVTGAFDLPGPATVWTKSRLPLVAGEPLTGLQRVLLVADSGNGIAAIAQPSELVFVNTDLTVHLHREAQGEDIWMHAETVIDALGVGLVNSVVGDTASGVGTAAQSLFVAPVGVMD